MFNKIKEVIKSFIKDADKESTKDSHKDEQGFSPSIGDSIWGNSLAHVHEMGAVVTFEEEVEEEGLYLYRFIDKEGMEECYGKMCDGVGVSVIDMGDFYSYGVFFYTDTPKLAVPICLIQDEDKGVERDILQKLGINVVSVH